MLLADMSERNQEIQENIYNLIPNFQIQAKYIPSASECIRKIIGENEYLLTKISKTVKFNFDFREEGSKSEKFNILINIIDNEKGLLGEERVKFSKQDKLTSKPINLMNFFMNLIWDPNTTIKQEYVKFLRCICRMHDKAVNINQEMIFKLYNCMVMANKNNPLIHARM